LGCRRPCLSSHMSLSKQWVATTDTKPKRAERVYGNEDVRKALRYLLAHEERGAEAPTPWAVAQRLELPSMYQPVRRGVVRVLRLCDQHWTTA